MHIRTMSTVLLGFGLISLFGCEEREGDRTTGFRDQKKTSPALSLLSSDQLFVTAAIQSGLAEVESGRVATERASNPDVKKFAQQMVDDHARANDDLEDIAKRKGLTIPDQPDPAQQSATAGLVEFSGVDFDRKYMGMMITDHVKAVSLFEDKAKLAKDPELRAFAEKWTPEFREHLKTARHLSGKLGGPPTAD